MERSMRTYLCVALSIMVVIAGYAASPWLPAVYSQEPSRPTSVVINHIVPIPPEDEEAGQGMELRVFFTVRDQYGDPIPEPDIGKVDFVVKDGTREETTYEEVLYPAPPNDDYRHIAFLLDTSKSMAQEITDLSDAAQHAVQLVPAKNTFIAVYKFSGKGSRECLLEQEETDAQTTTEDEKDVENCFIDGQRDWISSIITKKIGTAGGNTCLYDETYKTITGLHERGETFERRAIMLFSDGEDDTESGTPCSYATLEDVINESYDDDRKTQVFIYAVVLCKGDFCNPTEKVEGEPEPVQPLRYMAEKTGGFYVSANSPQELKQSFEDIVNAFKNQPVAQEDVSASNGNNTLTLKVYPQDSEEPLPGGNGESPPKSTFYSDGDYEISRDITFHDVLHDKNDNKWKIRFTLENPESIKEISIQAMDEENQPAATSEPITPKTGDMTATLEISEMGEYTFRAMADEQEIGKTSSYPYNPFSVDAIEPVWNENTLKISIKPNHNQSLEDKYSYSVSARKGTRTTYFLSEEKVPGTLNSDSDKVTLSITPIPDEMWKSKEDDVYKFTVKMQIGEGNNEAGTMEKTLEIRKAGRSSDNITASPPTFFQKTGHLLNTPIIGDGGIRYIHGLFLIVLVAVALIVYPRLRRKTVSIPAPYTPPTTNLEEPPQVTLRVIETPESSQKQETPIFVFPCTIGRGTDANIRITGDKKISRKHVSITIHDNEFFITDLGSSHGTFLGETRLTPNMPAPLKGAVTVRLGTETSVEMEAQQPGRRRR